MLHSLCKVGGVSNQQNLHSANAWLSRDTVSHHLGCLSVAIGGVGKQPSFSHVVKGEVVKRPIDSHVVSGAKWGNIPKI